MTQSESKNSPEKSNYVYDPLWAEALRRFIKSEKAKSGLTYDDLSHKIDQLFGTKQTTANLKSKVTRANFGAQLFLQILIAMDARIVDLDAIHQIYLNLKKNQH